MSYFRTSDGRTRVNVVSLDGRQTFVVESASGPRYFLGQTSSVKELGELVDLADLVEVEPTPVIPPCEMAEA